MLIGKGAQLRCIKCYTPFPSAVDCVADNFHLGVAIVLGSPQECPKCGLKYNHLVYKREIISKKGGEDDSFAKNGKIGL